MWKDNLGNQRVTPVVAAFVDDTKSTTAEFLANVVITLAVRDHFALLGQSEAARLTDCDGPFQDRHAFV